MPAGTKIATCCYCGTRAALVLKGRERHELACSSCGAPLHDLKMMPMRAPEAEAPRRAAPAPSPGRPARKRRQDRSPREVAKARKKRKKSPFRKLLGEAIDLVEDIFD